MLVPNAINGPTTGTFRTRATDRLAGERLAKETSLPEEWLPDTQELVQHIEDEQMRQREGARWQHVVVRRMSPEAKDVSSANPSYSRMSTIASYAMDGQTLSTKRPVRRRCSS